MEKERYKFNLRSLSDNDLVNWISGLKTRKCKMEGVPMPYSYFEKHLLKNGYCNLFSKSSNIFQEIDSISDETLMVMSALNVYCPQRFLYNKDTKVLLEFGLKDNPRIPIITNISIQITENTFGSFVIPFPEGEKECVDFLNGFVWMEKINRN